MEYILRTHDLGKSFNGDNVVSGINMNVEKGEIYGLLGPNGAGKSTVMKMILNLLKPSQGAIEIFNETMTDTSYELFKRMNAIIEYPIFFMRSLLQRIIWICIVSIWVITISRISKQR